MGALFSQRLIRATTAEFRAWKEQYHYIVIGTSRAARTLYRDVSYGSPVVLLLENEQYGLSHEQQPLCDMLVTIPMLGRSDSLNLAVAAGVVLYEIFAQQQSTSAIRQGLVRVAG